MTSGKTRTPPLHSESVRGTVQGCPGKHISLRFSPGNDAFAQLVWGLTVIFHQRTLRDVLI